jgi:hypothetical protein
MGGFLRLQRLSRWAELRGRLVLVAFRPAAALMAIHPDE